MKRLSPYVNLISTIVVGIVAWAFWMYAYPAHLHLHEQLQMFEFTSFYLQDTIAKPAGVAEYISRFLVQFFYDDKLGPVVAGVVSALLYNATTLLSSKVTSKKKSMQVSSLLLKQIVALLPVIMTTAFLIGLDAKFTLLVALCITLYAVKLTECLPKRIAPWAAGVIAAILAFCVGGVFVVYLLSYYGRLTVRGIEQKKWKHAAWLALALVLWGVTVLLESHVYPYPTSLLAWGENYNRFVYIDAPYNTLTWWGTIAAVLALGCSNTMVPRLVMLLPLIYTANDMRTLYDGAEESMLENMYLVRTNNWDAIIEKANKKAPESSYEMTGLNLALAMKGLLADRFFQYDQQGVNSLLPVYATDYMTPLFSAEAYFQMGMVNTAQRFYYEAMESIADYQKSAWYMKRLTQTALANGRIQLARSYIYKLKQTLYYSEWAKDMERYCDNPELLNANAEIARLRSVRVKHDTFFNDNYQVASIVEMLNDSPQNEVAWQYLFTMLMASGNMDDLLHTAQFYAAHSNKKLFPVHVQEALLYAWLAKTGSMNGFPWAVSTEVGQRFLTFVQQANQPREIAEPIVRRDYAGTFWCYAVFAAQQQGQQNANRAVDASTGASVQQPSRE